MSLGSTIRRLIGPLLILLVVGGGGTAALLAMRAQEADAGEARREAALERAGALAAELGRAVDQARDVMAGSFDEAAIAAALAAGDAGALAELEAAIAAADARILKVRIVPRGEHTPDYDSNPPLGFAAVELMRISEEGGQAPAPEAHLFGNDNQHVALIWRVSRGEELLGHLWMALDVAWLPEVMSRIVPAPGYAELTQSGAGPRPLVLAKGGAPTSRQGDTSLRLKVGETPWRLAYWPDPSQRGATTFLAELPVWSPAVLALVLVVLTVGGTAAMDMVRARRVAAEERAEAARRRAEQAKAAADKAAARQVGDADVEAAYATVEGESPGIVVEEEETKVKLPAEIFRAYDVRGVVGKSLTADVVRQIGRAIGAEAKARAQQTVVVGRDGRNSGPELQDALIEGLRGSGRDVIDVGRVPTPVLYFATHYLNTGSGVMVTGSHNPAPYNGLKIMLAGDTLFGDDIQRLRQRVESGELVKGDGSLQRMEVVDEYVRRVCEDIPVALGNSFRVVVDCGNGVAGEVAPKLLRALGHDVIELYCEVDGDFPNHHPDPSEPKNLADLIKTVKQEGADLGFAFDGDGDRLGVVDPGGRIIWADMQMMLFAKDVLSSNAGAEVVFDVKCSSRLARVIKQLGGRPVMWRTGHSFIKNKLKESGAPLAGEMSGHIFFQDRWYGFDDAIYAAARLLEILRGFKKAPKEIFAKLPAGVSTPELRVDIDEGEQTKLVGKLVQSDGFANGKRTTIDGLRVDYADGWGLVRASNTTPSLVLRFEADNKEALARIQNEFRQALAAIKPDLSLPF